MSGTEALTGLPAGIPAARPPTPPAPKSTLGQAEFLRLLTTQLQNQDPTKPVDNLQYVQQMAMFSQIAGTTEGNQKLDVIADRLDQLIALFQIPPPQSSAQSPTPQATEGT
ncbi:flagellar hook assembly protein FlgD [Sandarakinorhabdus rubra]|uniref:flagellar hook assembly protein FlgD n=1 Tax=Sandarakinorhabdus rubra TaxID=2672568 RepID=UPI0013DBC46C|nr:flagellar hook capping FlgD N-terminal domain-containing protein [Sandarakinorhabdus rubra]